MVKEEQNLDESYNLMVSARSFASYHVNLLLSSVLDKLINIEESYIDDDVWFDFGFVSDTCRLAIKDLYSIIDHCKEVL